MKSKAHVATGVLSALLWTATSEAAGWVCGVHFESQCDASGCAAHGNKGDGNTKPVSAQFDDQGHFRICMYSRCYEGKGRVLTTSPFLSITQERVTWNGANPDETDIFIVLERKELVGMFKAASFVQPIVCDAISLAD